MKRNRIGIDRRPALEFAPVMIRTPPSNSFTWTVFPLSRERASATRDLSAGLRYAENVRSGMVNINVTTNHWESHLPFGGGAGTASGIGRVGGRYPMETFTELRTVIFTA